jgi:hypothetical protein
MDLQHFGINGWAILSRQVTVLLIFSSSSIRLTALSRYRITIGFQARPELLMVSLSFVLSYFQACFAFSMEDLGGLDDFG